MKIFLTTYGGAHVALAVPLLKELSARGHLLSVLALTTAGPVLQREGIPHRRPIDYADRSDVEVERYGRQLLARHHTEGIGLSVEESVAYLGESYRELVRSVGERLARQRYGEQGLNAFLPVEFLTRVLRRESPDVVVTTDSPRMEWAALAAARGLDIPSVCAITSFPDIGIHYLRRPEHGDFLCVYSQKVRRQFIGVGRDPMRIVVTGNPAWDGLADPAPRQARPELRSGRGVHEDEILVLWAEQPEPGNEDLPRAVRFELARICRERAWKLLVRLHPSSTDPSLERIPEGALASPRTEPVLSALHMADVVVTFTSTVGYEALLLGKPVVVLRMSRFSHLVDYSPEEGGLVIDSLAELPEAIHTVTSDNPTAQVLRANRARLPQPGGAAARMARAIEGLAARAPRGMMGLSMRTITAVTVARSDWGIYLPVFRRIAAEPDLRLELIVAGGHLAAEFGATADEVVAAGFLVRDRIETLMASDTPAAIAKSIGLGVLGFSQAFDRQRPELLMLLGDRYEMLAAAVAALPLAIPIAHLHGGETTEGAIDEAIRHALTKMSHLHFASTPVYAKRIVQLGEEPWRVTVSGAPALDHLRAIEPLSREDLESRLGMPLTEAPLLVTFHPVTLEHEQVEAQLAELLAALDRSGLPLVFTYPGADTHSRAIIRAIEEFVRDRPRAVCVNNLGSRAYFSTMARAAVMVGNSSSGIIEAASFRLPVVNVGNRQRGRLHAENVIDVPCQREAIGAGIRRAAGEEFRRSLATLENPYGDGQAAGRIVEVLKSVPLDERLIEKRFHDL